MKLRILLATVVLLAVPAAQSASKPNLDKFAQCLTAKKAVMYGTFWCGHCTDQKALFGDSVKHITYVECSENGQRKASFACLSKGIKRTPTWIFADETRHEGLLTLEQLSQRTGCKLP